MMEHANVTMLTFAAPIFHDLSTSILDMPSMISQVFYHYVSWSTAFKIVLGVLIMLNFKVFPFIYHLRILNAVRFVLKSQRPPKPITPAQLFQPLITSSRACLLEMDILGHKSNSTYFLDVDVARAHLVTTMFSTAIEKFRGSTTMNGLSGRPKANFTLALGAVSCTFRKEIRPYEQYDLWTRILSWDQKWFYLVTHFVKRGVRLEPQEYTLYPKQNRRTTSPKDSQNVTTETTHSADASRTTGARSSPICATALSKVVFKDSRLTIAPEAILEAAGLLPPLNADNQAPTNAQPVANGKVTRRISPGIPGDKTTEVHGWTREKIEAERVRGLAVAKLLGEQTALEDEFHHQVALGRHYDGFGIEGVVATLAQLGKISNYQLL